MRFLFDHPLGWVCHMIWVMLALFVVGYVARALWRIYKGPPH